MIDFITLVAAAIPIAAPANPKAILVVSLVVLNGLWQGLPQVSFLLLLLSLLRFVMVVKDYEKNPIFEIPAQTANPIIANAAIKLINPVILLPAVLFT